MILRRFVLSADWHLTGKRPRCRMDVSWLDRQCEMVRFLVGTAILYKVDLVCTGDLFDHHKVATEVVNMVLRELKRLHAHGLQFYVIPGNHCLEGHRADSIPRGSIGTLLETFPMIPQINGIQDAQPFGLDNPTGAKVAFTHQLVFKDEKSRPPMAKGFTAAELLDQFPDADWIFTGDHHAPWHFEQGNRHVVNPGCTLIHNAGDIGNKAQCALVDIDVGTVSWIEIPDDPTNLSDGHLRTEEERVSRIEAFLEKVQGQGEAKILDFKGNLELKSQQLDPKSPVCQALVRIKDKATTKEK